MLVIQTQEMMEMMLTIASMEEIPQTLATAIAETLIQMMAIAEMAMATAIAEMKGVSRLLLNGI
jgi:hypothetical protein